MVDGKDHFALVADALDRAKEEIFITDFWCAVLRCAVLCCAVVADALHRAKEEIDHADSSPSLFLFLIAAG
jgi:phosphatidylserine/phosphatidylglycerophosphate/cardiolipin synthase-like enzyme